MTWVRFAVALSIAMVIAASPVHSQDWEDSEINLFGYLQAQVFTRKNIRTEQTANSFNLQQLNLMAQRTFTHRWSAFVNIEMVNTFSSANGWGSINVEEAWARYRRGHKLNVTMGLLIPKFNRLNEIKNRMPVLPYIVRPLIYESSLADVVAIDEFVPRRAFVQAHGFFITGPVKIDYAVYAGNSPMVNSSPMLGQTGVDTTDTMMGGGRIGIRAGNVKFGISGTGEQLDFPEALEDTLAVARGSLQGVERSRVGVDLSFQIGRFDFEFEAVSVDYHEDVTAFNPDKEFGYGTAGFHINDRWYVYVSYWDTKQHFNTVSRGFFETRIKIPSIGFSYSLHDRIALKGQFGSGEHETEEPGVDAAEQDFEYSAFAVSVFF